MQGLQRSLLRRSGLPVKGRQSTTAECCGEESLTKWSGNLCGRWLSGSVVTDSSGCGTGISGICREALKQFSDFNPERDLRIFKI